MPDTITKNFVLRCGHVRRRDWLGFVAFSPEAESEEVPNGQIFFLDASQEWKACDVAWTAVGLTSTNVPIPIVVMLGRDGNALVGDSEGISEEVVEDRGVGPARRGPMRQIRTIDSRVFAVGMGRQVYEREAKHRWLRVENGLPERRPMGQVVGFNAIDGFSVSQMYAVGWKGEIWKYDGLIWSEVDSPTNLALFDIVKTESGDFYAGGQSGVLLRGHGDVWSEVSYEGPPLEFRSLAWFNGKLYLADGTSLHRFQNNTLSQVDFGVGEPVPSNHLHTNDGILLSTSGKEAFMTTDGVTWTPVPV